MPIAMASEVLQTITKDERERAWLMSEYKYAVDTQSKIVHAKRETRKEVARILKAAGIPAGQIVQWTGLTEEHVKEL